MALSGQGDVPGYVYLVLAAVLTALAAIALIFVAPLLQGGDSPESSSAYWAGAKPISILEAWAIADEDNVTYPYLKLKNNGERPVRITRLLGGGKSIGNFYNDETSAEASIDGSFTLAPGDAAYFGQPSQGKPGHWVGLQPSNASAAPGESALIPAASVCSPFGSLNPGIARVDGFGFEYVEEIGGQELTRQEPGAKPLVVYCKPY